MAGRRSEDKLSEDEVRRIAHEAAEEAAEEAAHKVLERIGFDMSNPHSIQEDVHLLRRLREAQEKGKMAVVWGIFVAAGTGAANLIWQALRLKGG